MAGSAGLDTAMLQISAQLTEVLRRLPDPS